MKRLFFTFSHACLDINNTVVSDRLGMPPMYMVVDIRWDDYAPDDEIVQMQDPTKDIFQNNSLRELLGFVFLQKTVMYSFSL